MNQLIHQHHNILCHKGRRLQEEGRLNDAVQCFSSVIGQDAGHLEALQGLAEIAHSRNNLAEAADYYTRLLEQQPQNVQQLNTLAQILFQQNKLRQACHHLQTVIRLDPANVLAHSNLGYILYLLGESSQAMTISRNAVHLGPDCVDALCNLAVVLISRQNYRQAHDLLIRALHLAPDFGLAWTNLAIVLLHFGNVTDSISASRKALLLNGQRADVYCNLGMALQEKMQIREALTAYSKALELQPHHLAAQSNRLMCLQYALYESSKQLRKAATSFRISLQPRTGQKKVDPAKKQLRIGYVSGDFKQHPVGWFLQAILRVHDKKRVEIHCYDTANQPDAITAVLQADADHWHRIHNMTDEEAAELIQDNHIDILVDLAGHTAGNRLGIFALKPVPVQVSWLGYFASTGLDAMDYVFLGADQAPAGSDAFFHEKLYRLRQCQFIYTPPKYAPSVTQPPHLHTGTITFGCFNNSAKLNMDVLMLWAQLLQQVADSRLILKWRSFNDQQFSGEIRNVFYRAGIAQERIELRGASEHSAMLAEYGEIDIALDPFPFSGALTTSEALWMGVPVITYAALRPVSRQSAAILKNLSHPELIAHTPDEYLAIAGELARNSRLLSRLRPLLRQRMADMATDGADSLTRELEDAFFTVYRNASHQFT